jgi:hypothetical protein
VANRFPSVKFGIWFLNQKPTGFFSFHRILVKSTKSVGAGFTSQTGFLSLGEDQVVGCFLSEQGLFPLQNIFAILEENTVVL